MYRDLNDCEIIYMVKEGNEDYEVILRKYEPLIYKIIHKYKKVLKGYGLEVDDLYQISAMAIFKCIKSYSENYNNLFYTYILRSIENAIVNEIRNNQTYKKATLNISFSYDQAIPNTNLTYIDVIPDYNSLNFIENIYWEDKYISLKNSLSYELSGIFELRFNGYKNREIAVLLDQNIVDINNKLALIRKKLTYNCLCL